MTDFETIDRAIDRMKNRERAQRIHHMQELARREENRLLFGECEMRPFDETSLESPADIEQRVFLEMHGQCQERTEKSFCWGMLAGGVIALTVYTVTLVLVGVIK